MSKHDCIANDAVSPRRVIWIEQNQKTSNNPLFSFSFIPVVNRKLSNLYEKSVETKSSTEKSRKRSEKGSGAITRYELEDISDNSTTEEEYTASYVKKRMRDENNRQESMISNENKLNEIHMPTVSKEVKLLRPALLMFVRRPVL